MKSVGIELEEYVNGYIVRWVKFKVGRTTTEAYIWTWPWWDIKDTLLKGSVIFRRTNES